MRVLISVLFASTVWGYRHLQDEIPNGGGVPHPCKANYIWGGVGHLDPHGGGDINPFGLDFKNAGMKWTKFLCEMDSDKDGKTNGEELGDPDCVWTKGNIPTVTIDISHPGVCTPHSAPACQAVNNWIDCRIGDLQCDALSEVGMKNITLRFPETAVPSDETNYLCMFFDLPTDGDYHFVAMEPYIDNVNVMHHMLLYGCENPDAATQDMTKPRSCGMSKSTQCKNLLAGWGIGSSGTCYGKEAAVRIGQIGIRQVVLQIHWNNPELRSDYTDSSGMTLYYTKNHRPNDLKMWEIGLSHSDIPPGEAEFEVEAWCRSDCTSRYLSGPVYITKALNHMHYLGRKERIQQYRDGLLVRDITNDDSYAYDKFVEFSLETPIEFKPGDEIKITCTYRTVGKDRTTFIGGGTTDEMCLGFLFVFPAQNLHGHSCWSVQDIDLCKIQHFSSDFPLVNGCNIKKNANPLNPENVALFKNLKKLCKPFDICTHECKQYVKGILESNKCFQGSIYALYRQISIEISSHFMEIWAAVDSCKTEIELDYCQTQCDSGKNSDRTIGRG
ncbi:Tyramine beta-hydroxylase [Mizuhopecten yessoensis]|uniref:Tyramine beta-hydroxylase n=2 Tax=Mizuhopecten yessoensis TaxID=6573 RepID=A0A210QCM7_MIZYE|nr:Tyramine beta-hydroxylase [Mizuhopecten yessoensis]